jgi:hypothetical protein
MDLKEFQNITNQIAQNLNNQALVTNLLTQLNEDYTTTTNTIENATKQANERAEEIKVLQDTNMQLFLKISSPPKEVTAAATEPPKFDTIIASLEGAK